MYRGEVDVQPEQLQSFLRTAELLQIKGLADQNLCNTATESEASLNSLNRSSPDVPIVSQEDDKKRIRALSPPMGDEVLVNHNRNQGIASPNIGIHHQIGSPGGNISNFPSQQITQQLVSDKLGKKAHDEMLFIITHQVYELFLELFL